MLLSLFISEPGASRIGEREDGQVNGTDLFSTISQLAGSPLDEVHNSKSFLNLLTQDQSIRDYNYSQKQDIDRVKIIM